MPQFWSVMFALAILLIATAILAILTLQRSADADRLNRRFKQAFGQAVQPQAPRSWLEQLGNKVIPDKENKDSGEIRLFMVRAGWKRKSDFALFYAVQWLLPLCAVIFSGPFILVGGSKENDWAAMFLVASAAYLLPKRLLAFKASSRQRRIAEQVPVLVHLLRVLLSTGLSVEQALRALAQDIRTLLPDMAHELDYILRMVTAGEDLALAMRRNAEQLDVPALTDLTMILEQTWRLGGSVLNSLRELSDLLESRMQTDLKERVSKLSGKMTIVMMLFLFPALLILLAAPGFMAVAAGLKNAAG
ncbi:MULTISPECIES: type II secretion system F family protein [Methylomonas]|uniref:type II secretion system F family protein n=1 Tax=Methylomonas TaxID=416 RepID=UPI001231B88E|nr:type II secretion system F family protein [Methylomonas rhizoryzae]